MLIRALSRQSDSKSHCDDQTRKDSKSSYQEAQCSSPPPCEANLTEDDNKNCDVVLNENKEISSDVFPNANEESEEHFSLLQNQIFKEQDIESRGQSCCENPNVYFHSIENKCVCENETCVHCAISSLKELKPRANMIRNTRKNNIESYRTLTDSVSAVENFVSSTKRTKNEQSNVVPETSMPIIPDSPSAIIKPVSSSTSLASTCSGETPLMVQIVEHPSPMLPHYPRPKRPPRGRRLSLKTKTSVSSPGKPPPSPKRILVKKVSFQDSVDNFVPPISDYRRQSS